MRSLSVRYRSAATCQSAWLRTHRVLPEPAAGTRRPTAGCSRRTEPPPRGSAGCVWRGRCGSGVLCTEADCASAASPRALPCSRRDRTEPREPSADTGTATERAGWTPTGHRTTAGPGRPPGINLARVHRLFPGQLFYFIRCAWVRSCSDRDSKLKITQTQVSPQNSVVFNTHNFINVARPVLFSLKSRNETVVAQSSGTSQASTVSTWNTCSDHRSFWNCLEPTPQMWDPTNRHLIPNRTAEKSSIIQTIICPKLQPHHGPKQRTASAETSHVVLS